MSWHDKKQRNIEKAQRVVPGVLQCNAACSGLTELFLPLIYRYHDITLLEGEHK